MSLVRVHNEWDSLEEVIVGVADNARIPSPDRGLFALDYADMYPGEQDVPSGPYSRRVIEETTEDLERLAEFFVSQGVVVRRPRPTDHAVRFQTPGWAADGEYNYCPRDVLLPVGETLIEAPMVLRTRYFEPLAYRDILLEYFKSGANWVSAPKPSLPDETYSVRPTEGTILKNLEPLFDAANVLRVGKDIVYQVSRSGNMLGCQWLQRLLGDGYRVHPVEGVYDGTHIDTTITLVRPGLVVLNPERIPRDGVPDVFKKWDVIWCPSLFDTMPGERNLRASPWMGMNFMMVTPDLAVVDEAQTPLIRELEGHGVTVAPLPLRHSRTLSGGFHCVTLDVRRSGELEDYS